MLLARIVPLNDGWWAVHTPYHDAVVAQFKAMPGCVYDRNRGAWVGPKEAVRLVLDVLVAAKLAHVEYPSESAPVSADVPSTLLLYDYQRDGVEFILNTLHDTGAALLADDMGLGKSTQALHAAAELRAKRVLILCPPVVVPHWRNEVKRWLHLEVAALGAKIPKKQGGGRVLNWEGFAVCGYDTFRSLKDVIDADVLVLDELHYLSNSKALRTKAVQRYIAGMTNRPRIIGLTGTPMTARPRDLWCPLDILWPSRFGVFFKFAKRYCDARYVEVKGVEKPVFDTSGASNLEELGKRLRAGLMLRRIKSEVLNLPARQRITMPVDMPPRARAALAKAAAAVRGDQDLGRALSAVEEYKLDAAIGHVSDLRAQGKRVLVFTLRRASAKRIGEELSVPYVTGEDPVEERRAKLLGSDVGVATVYSVTTGIDLTEFDVAVFVGLDWVPSTLLQAEARIHRIGQAKDVVFYYLIGLGTLDETIQATVIERLDHFGQIVGEGGNETDLSNTLRGKQSDTDLLQSILDSIQSGGIK